MDFFDFHHHKKEVTFGIYNAEQGLSPADVPYSAGIHPKDIIPGNIMQQMAWLRSSVNENCFAIGECGLDGQIAVDMRLQKEVFQKQIEISNEVRKPIIIHCVKRFQEIIGFRKKAEQPMIIHGFHKKQQVAEALLKNNFYLSFGKAVLYHLSLQDTLKKVPLDKIFLETDDAAFDIGDLYQKTAEIKQISLDELKNQITENLERIRNG